MRVAPIVIALLAIAAFPSRLLAEPLNASPAVVAQLQLHWHAAEPRYWDVTLQFDESSAGRGVLDQVIDISQSDRVAGAIKLNSERSGIVVQPRHALHGGGIALAVRGALQDTLSLQIVSRSQRGPEHQRSVETRKWTLREILEQSAINSSDGQEAPSNDQLSWSISRLPGTELQIEGLPSTGVMPAGSPLKLSIQPSAMLAQASQRRTLQTSLIRVDNGQVIWSHRSTLAIDSFGNSDPVLIDEPIPELAGVYEVRCDVLAEEDNIWTRLRRRQLPLVRVGKPLVVLDKQSWQYDESIDGQAKVPWRSVGVVRPSSASGSVSQWLPQSPSRLIIGERSEASTPNVPLQVATHAETNVSILPPQGTFQATLPVQYAGRPHRVTLRYPDDQPVRLLVQIGRPGERDRAATSFEVHHPMEVCPGKHWQTHSFTVYPRPDDQIWLTNLAATDYRFETISVHAGPERVADKGTIQSIDRASSDSALRSAVMRVNTADWFESLSHAHSEDDLPQQYDPATVAAWRRWHAIARLADEVRSRGMNGVLVPTSADEVADPLVMLLQVMESAGIEVYLAIEPRELLSSVEQVLDEQPDRVLEMTRGTDASQYQLFHPLVLPALSARVAKVVDRYRDYTSLAGVALLTNEQNHLESPGADIRDRYLVTSFAAEQPALASEPYEAQVAWIEKEGLTAFQSWVDTKTVTAYRQIAEAANGLPVLLIASASDCQRWIRKQADKRSPLPGSEPLQFAADFQFGSVDDLSEAQLLSRQLASIDPANAVPIHVASLSAANDSRSVARRTLVSDLTSVVHRMNPRWMVVDRLSLRGDQNPEVANFFRTFTAMPASGLIPLPGSDPANQTVGVRAGHRNDHLVVTVTSLVPWLTEVDLETTAPVRWRLVGPTGSEESVTTTTPGGLTPGQPPAASAGIALAGAGKTLADAGKTLAGAGKTLADAGKTLTGGGKTLADAGQSLAGTGRLLASTHDAAPLPWQAEAETPAFQVRSETRVRISVPAGHTVVLESVEPAADSELRFWSSRVGGGVPTLDEIKGRVTKIVERLGALSNFPAYSSLTNGGFEQSGEMGLVGWLHAQHPPGCVRLDTEQPLEGKQSVLLTTDANANTRTWIVSEKIAAPPTGRLAVSLACRSEMKANHPPHRLKISLEATSRGMPVRFSREIEVPRDGHWGSRAVVLEADQIDDRQVDSLRLTIDSLSGGRLWIDDVRLHDHFATEQERDQLQSLAFLAVQGLQRGNLAPTARLLKNHWARHLLSMQNVEVPPPVNPQKPVPPPTPGVAERLRGWLPAPLRF